MKLREIKFRIWDKKYSMFDYNSSPELFISTEGDVYELDRDEYNKADYYDVSQYTGLKDKNGKEIYEGDIVELIVLDSPFAIQGNGYFDVDIAKGFNAVGVVKFLYSCWFIDQGEKKGCPLDFDEKQQLSVIGNIYENPELLEVLQ